MVSHPDYGRRGTDAARIVLDELRRIFSNLDRAIVLAGGSTPAVTCSNEEEGHIGTMDVDLVVSEVPGVTGKPLNFRARLLRNGYRPGESPHEFLRDVVIDGEAIVVPVELLAGQSRSMAGRESYRNIGDAKALRVRGAELAFRYNEVPMKGGLRVVGPAAFLAMKAIAASDEQRRAKRSKDCYDIVYYLKHYHGGLKQIVGSVRDAAHDDLVAEGVRLLARLFAAVSAPGPTSYGEFTGVGVDREERAVKEREAYELVSELMTGIGWSS